jgi:general secretion pathway protein I
MTRRGVTLIETLAALALLAAVAVPLTRVWTLASDVAGRSRAQILAAILAENKLNELFAEGNVADAAGEGDFGPDYPDFTWRIDVSSWPEDPGYWQIDVTVSWTRRSLEYATTLTSLTQAGQEGSR